MNAAAKQHSSGTATFPEPVRPAAGVEAVRLARLADLTRVTLIGISLRLVIIAAEFLGVWLCGSAALLVDAVASVFDVLSSLVLLAAIRFAARPPDEDHPFGHGRAEPLAGFQLGVLLSATGVWMAWENLRPISQGVVPHVIPLWLAAIPGGAAILLMFLTAWVRKAAQESRSTALRAEGMHFQVDAFTSLVTMITLVVAAVWHEHAALCDHLGAAFLAVLMTLLGGQAIWENLHQLLDRVPQDEDFHRVRTSALGVPGVIDVEKLQIQHAGPDAHVNIDIEVDPEISVENSHRIAQQVRARIQTDWPFVRDVIVHVEPWYEGDH